jgi:CRISPR/Cas system CMR subunit Cmr6 (Cas7 group RAMP superfamily)
MANKVLLKKSSVAARIPTTSDLDYGEIALNYADEKLYFKNSSNVVKSISAVDTTSLVTLTGTQTLTNKSLTSPTLTGTPVAPTATAGDVSTQIATTAFADNVALNKAVAMAIALG